MDGNTEHGFVQRREGLDIRSNGRLLMTEPVHLDRCLLPDEETFIKKFCEAAPLGSCDH